ncbi:MAG: uncharacterized protein QOJ62_17 [Actinomycetota bacterium]|nr:uncharacterized protein [Actinomycetota bacterium]
MTPDNAAARLTIYLGAADLTGVRPAPDEIIRRAHAAGLVGAMVTRALPVPADGTRTRTISLSDPASVIVTILDREDRLRLFLQQLDDVRAAGASMQLEGVDDRDEVGVQPIES